MEMMRAFGEHEGESERSEEKAVAKGKDVAADAIHERAAGMGEGVVYQGDIVREEVTTRVEITAEEATASADPMKEFTKRGRTQVAMAAQEVEQEVQQESQQQQQAASLGAEGDPPPPPRELLERIRNEAHSIRSSLNQLETVILELERRLEKL